MVKIANVKVNNSRAEGNIGGSDNISKDMLKELKQINSSMAQIAKQGKLNDIFGGDEEGGGLLGGGGLLSQLKNLLGLTGAGAVAGAGAALAGAGTSSSESRVGYEKALVGGEEKVLEINRITGEILNVLNLQEAADKEILDEKNNIKFYISDGGIKWEEATKKLTSYKDMLIISNAELTNLISLEKEQTDIQKQINAQMRLNLRKLGSTSSRGASLFPTDSEGNFSLTSAPSAGPSIVITESTTDINLLRDKWDQVFRQSNDDYITGLYKTP